MSLSIFVRLTPFLFDKEPLWAVQFNKDGLTWKTRQLTQQQAIAQAAANQWGLNRYRVTKIASDTFNVEAEHAPGRFRPLGVATCIRA